MKVVNKRLVKSVMMMACLVITAPAWSWGCQIDSAGQRAGEPQRPPQARLTLYVGEVGVWGDLQARLSKIEAAETAQLDIKAPNVSQQLQLTPNVPHTLQLCGKEVMVTLNSLGNASATLIVSVF